MIENEIQFRKKREIGDILSDSFQFIKQEYKPISSLIITYVLPFLILYGIAQVYLQIKVIGNIDLTDQEALLNNFIPIYGNIFLFSLFGIFVQSLLFGTYYSYIEVYVKKGKGNFELDEIKDNLFSNSLLALGAGLVVFIITVFGVIMCILPGIYFANTYSLVVMIVVFEKKGLGNALTRSWDLVKSQWWNTFLLNLISLIFIWVVGFILSIPSTIAGITSTLLGPQEISSIDYPDWFWVLTGISTIITSLLWFIPATFLAMQYFNLDERQNPTILPNNDSLS